MSLFKLFIVIVTIPLHAPQTMQRIAINSNEPCFEKQTPPDGDIEINLKTGMRIITYAHCRVVAAAQYLDRPATLPSPAPTLPPGDFSPDDPHDPLRGYNPLEVINQYPDLNAQ